MVLLDLPDHAEPGGKLGEALGLGSLGSRVLSLLRQEKGVSQRKAAAELGISQALLSNYENGIRESWYSPLLR